MGLVPHKPVPEPPAGPSSEVDTIAPSLSLPVNQPFRALSRLANPSPNRKHDKAASAQNWAAIEHQWKNDWRSDEAQRLYRRTIARRAAKSRTVEKEADGRSIPTPSSGEFTGKLSFSEQTVLHGGDPDKYERYLDWLFALHAPVTTRWGLREFLHRRDPDREREIARGDEYEIISKQSG